MLLNEKKLLTIVNEDLNDGFNVTKLILKTSKKLIDNTHKKASYSTAIDMKLTSKFGTRRYWLKKLS